MSSGAQSSEARELSLIDKVELRIALADTDAKLESILKTYLAPLLLKLLSEHLSVRNKVIGVCRSVNQRTQPQNIRLPVEGLVKQYKENAKHALLIHFDLLFIQRGIERLSSAEKGALFPVFCPSIADDLALSPGQKANVLNLLFKCLVEYRFPRRGDKEEVSLRERLAIGQADAECLAFWFGKLLLIRSGQAASAEHHACPGVSAEEFDILTLQNSPHTWDSTAPDGLNLPVTKTAILRALSSSLFTNEERLVPALIASADPNSNVADAGDELLKTVFAAISLDSATLLRALFDTYFGSEISANNVSTFVPPVRTSVKIKLVNTFARSAKTAEYHKEVIRMIKEGILPQASTGAEGSKEDRESVKLRSALITLLSFLARNATHEDLQKIAQEVIAPLKYFLDQYYADSGSLEIKNIRGKSFELIGLLLHVSPEVVKEPQLSLLKWLFQSLAEEGDRDVVFSIDEALSAAIRPFQSDCSPQVMQALRELLLGNLTSDTRNPRNTLFNTVRFTNRCLEYSDVTARWIDLYILSSSPVENHDLIEESKKGLDPYWHRLFRASGYQSMITSHGDSSNGVTSNFPNFSELSQLVFGANKKQIDITPALLAHGLKYARQILFLECLTTQGKIVEIDSEWERRLDLMVDQDGQARTAIRQQLSAMLADVNQTRSIEFLFGAATQGLKMHDPQIRRECANILLELCILGTDSLLHGLFNVLDQLQEAVIANDIQIRSAASHCFGLVVSAPSVDPNLVSSSLEHFMSNISTWQESSAQHANTVHGSILALAYALSRSNERNTLQDTRAKILPEFLSHVFGVIKKSAESILQNAAYEALSQLSLFGMLTLPMLEQLQPFKTTIDQFVKKSRESNLVAITALGNITASLDEDKDSELLEFVVDQIRSLHEIRQPETQFTVGEALCAVSYGWESKHLSSKYDLESATPRLHSRKSLPARIVQKILEDCKNSKPALKKASTIWLLCFVQFCGQQKDIQSNLVQFQNAFKRCLSDRDELVQESASRGLGLVYESGDRALKDDLVRDLVNSFSGEKTNMSGSVTADTQLFEEGELPTGDGSITTYKDIMNLAAEVGDPSLVYRFMSLASHNAIWSSRAAFGRFGLSDVLSDSSVEGYLAKNPKLYPKLYRYRFDANSKVRRSMTDIWNALVKDSAGTIDKHFEAIIEDLLATMIGREWRGRQASCAALADLLQGRELEQILPYLERAWTACYKVLDDIKESVRAAASELARVLTGILIRSLEAGGSKKQASVAMLQQVLPFLLSTSGLEASAEDVRAFSLQTLLQIIRKAPPAVLRPFIPELIERLLAMLSTFEPEAVNYIHLNASKYNMKQQDIDEARLRNVRSSPLMEAIERCVDHLDEETMAKLAPRLVDAIKSAVGVPTKVGCSRALVSLSTRRVFLFKPYAKQFLMIVQKRVVDRNPTVTSSYASAIGYIARNAEDKDILETAQFAKRLYFGAGSEQDRLTSADIVQAIAKQATDKFRGLAAAFLPFVFFGCLDSSKEVSSSFRETWDSTAGGPRAASLYLGEIATQAGEHLGSNSWAIKHAAALSVAEAVVSVSKSKGSLTAQEGETLWAPLKTAMAEKTWDGKGRVCEAFAQFVESATSFWRERGPVEADIAKIAVREAKRRNVSYQETALKALGRVAATRPATDLFGEIVGICEGLLAVEHDAMDVDETNEDERPARRRRLGAAFEAMTSGALASEPGLFSARAAQVLDCASRLPAPRAAALDATVFAALAQLFGSPDSTTKPGGLDARPAGPVPEAVFRDSSAEQSQTLQARFTLLVSSSSDAPLEAQRAARASACGAFANALGAAQSPVTTDFPALLAALRAREVSPAIQKTLAQAQQALSRNAAQ